MIHVVKYEKNYLHISTNGMSKFKKYQDCYLSLIYLNKLH